MRLKFGCCDNEPAIARSEWLLDPIRDEFPRVSVELVPLKESEDDGLQQALRNGRVDFVIRALEEVPLELPDDLPLVAFSSLRDSEEVPVSPAAGHGILAVQTRRGTDCSCLKPIRSTEAAWCALAERAFVRSIGGHAGAYARLQDSLLVVTGYTVKPDGSTFSADILGQPELAQVLGETLANHMKD